MKIELLGHGLHKNNTNTVGHIIIDSFRNPDYYSFVGFSAFTKMSGLNKIKDELIKSKNHFKNIRFYLGIVEKGTSREALEFLLDNEIETWVFCTEDEIMFHPKIYLFEGKHNNRFVIGSSNLTSFGLFNNIEASTFLQFSKNDNQGKKFLKQFNDYFKSILDGSDKSIQLLTLDVLSDLIKSGYVWSESKTRDDFEYIKNNKSLFGRRDKHKFNKEELTEIKSKTTQKKYDSKEIPPITDEYMESWQDYFELFIEFKKENRDIDERFSVTIPKDYKNPSLYSWYRKQKIYYTNKLLPPEHEILLRREKFYFGDAHILWQEWKTEQKLKLLQEAVDNGEDIGLSQRYEYKGVRLGTWIQGVKKANKAGKKLDVMEKIKDIVDITSKTRNPIDTANRFINDLYEANESDKAIFQKRFNSAIRDQVNELPEDIQQEIVDVWYLVFNEVRPLGKIREWQKDKTEEWKAFRYNSEINPEGKWFSTMSLMGDIYSWVRSKREAKSRMDLVKHRFNETEKKELRREGFPI